jgi:TonB dependent receptor
MGRHTLKFGGEHRVLDFSNLAWSGATGSYTFDSTWVKASSTAAGSPLGGSMAAFLLGLPSSGSYTINTASKSDSNYEVLFLQDDWHVRPNLTINAGLRWEYNSPTKERWDRQSIGFDPGAVNQVTTAARAAYAKAPLAQLAAGDFNPVGGLLFATPDNRTPTTTTKKAFSPRFGISWTPAALHNRTVLRAGVGIFDYLYGVILPQQPGFSYTNTFVATNNSFLSPAATLSNPFPNGLQQPPGASQGLNTNLGQSVTYLNPALGRQYSLRWTFDVQQQITHSTTLEVGYIGNHSVHLATNYNFGTLPAQYLSTSLVRDNATITALGALVANPFAGLLPGTSMNGSTIALSSLLRPYPEFTGVTMQDMSNGGSYFHQLAAKLSRRLSGGLLLAVDYSHSRLMEAVAPLNNGDPKLEKRVSTYDRPNNFAISSLYELPFGAGRRFASGARRLTNLLIGNWAIATGYTFHSGAPVAWGNMLYYGGDLHYDARNVNHAFDTTRFNTVSAQQLSQNYRYFPSQFNNIRVDATNNLNVTVMKDFALREKVKLQFRADSFNLCNHALFAAPTVSPTSGAFGVISSTTNTPRIIQSALRLTF